MFISLIYNNFLFNNTTTTLATSSRFEMRALVYLLLLVAHVFATTYVDYAVLCTNCIVTNVNGEYNYFIRNLRGALTFEEIEKFPEIQQIVNELQERATLRYESNGNEPLALKFISKFDVAPDAAYEVLQSVLWKQYVSLVVDMRDNKYLGFNHYFWTLNFLTRQIFFFHNDTKPIELLQTPIKYFVDNVHVHLPMFIYEEQHDNSTIQIKDTKAVSIVEDSKPLVTEHDVPAIPHTPPHCGKFCLFNAATDNRALRAQYIAPWNVLATCTASRHSHITTRNTSDVYSFIKLDLADIEERMILLDYGSCPIPFYKWKVLGHRCNVWNNISNTATEHEIEIGQRYEKLCNGRQSIIKYDTSTYTYVS